MSDQLPRLGRGTTCCPRNQNLTSLLIQNKGPEIAAFWIMDPADSLCGARTAAPLGEEDQLLARSHTTDSAGRNTLGRNLVWATCSAITVSAAASVDDPMQRKPSPVAGA